MAPPTPRNTYKLDLGQLPPLVPASVAQNPSRPSSSASSPIEPPQGNNGTSRFGHAFNGLGSARMGAGSPSQEYGGRLYPRRAREIQASEGHSWGPPTASGLSTPLRETIPESPNDDTFPEFGTTTINDQQAPSRNSSVRRTRAGTVPSRFPVGAELSASAGQTPKASLSTRPTPSGSPHRPGTASVPDVGGHGSRHDTVTSLLSRYRAGSMPQKSTYGTSSPFGPSIFSSNWNTTRERSSTVSSHRSDDSPGPASASKDPLYETDMKTLSYLGLDDASQQMDRFGQDSFFPAQYGLGSRHLLSQLNRVPSNRYRSYSVNAKEKYALEEEESVADNIYGSGTLTPSARAAAAAYAATQAQIYQHNLDVQAFANQASSSRPRARTAGLLDSPSSRMWRSGVNAPSRLDNTMNASDMIASGAVDYSNLSNAVQAMQLSNGFARDEDQTRAIWLGGVPSSSTPSSLKAIFEKFGKIESARVLTNKGCGFINFENIENAIRAKASLNGTEIFPGAGPVRIAYAKTLSGSGTPGAQDLQGGIAINGHGESSAFDSFNADQSAVPGSSAQSPDGQGQQLHESRTGILEIVREFGSTQQELMRVSEILDSAIHYDNFMSEIPPTTEPAQVRLYDVPRLREIRKRIDNQTCSSQEIEEIAHEMLPEIAELSSDYLGNTVVQKLFENCSDPVKEAMLREIAPHLAEIGVHKNGTWAAQKVIDLASTHEQVQMIIDGLRPYSVPSFLDQYGNYVMQCCLKFGSPANNFIFECMMGRLSTLAEARFGARAMRACLESHYASKDQQKMVAAAIVLHSVQLASNANGALLLTWFLDTCTFRNRRKMLAPRLISSLVHLCTHKVAYMTVLKLINQREEPEARQTMLQALFFSSEDETLEAILKDQSCGATLIFKVLTTPFFDEPMRSELIENTRRVLTKLKVQAGQGYKRLMDEVGLSARGPATTGRENGSDPSPKKGRSSHTATSSMNMASPPMNGNGSMYPGQSSLTTMMMDSNGMPSNNFDAYTMNGMALSSYPQNMPSPMTPHHMFSTPQFGQSRSPGSFGYPQQMLSPMNAYSTPMTGGFAPRTPQQQMPMVSSPIMQQGYNPMMGMSPGPWQQYQSPPYQMVPQQQPNQIQGMMNGGSGRRGRR